MKILCFSGTGNSLEVAKRIAKLEDGEVVSIPKLISEGIYAIVDDTVGIVFPIYYLSVPRMVDLYLSKLQITSKYIFVIMTHANISLESKALARDYNFQVDYFNQIKMSNNYIPWFDLESINNKIDYQQSLHKIELDISNRITNTNYNFLKYTIGNVVRKTHKPNPYELDKNFYVTSECTRCTLCERVCVSNNIVVQNRVNFNQKCEQCMSCINSCPKNAIQHRSQKSTARYLNQNIKLRDLIDLNNVVN